MVEKILDLDRDLLIYFNRLGIADYDLFWLYATNALSWTPLFLLLLYIIYIKYPFNEVVTICFSILITLLVTLIITELTKHTVMRIRPNNNTLINHSLRILKHPLNYSFFSGHASSSMAISTMVILFLRSKTKWIYVFYIWPLTFSFSRLYLAVHYPSDIIVGILIGFLIGFTAYRITSSYISKRSSFHST